MEQATINTIIKNKKDGTIYKVIIVEDDYIVARPVYQQFVMPNDTSPKVLKYSIYIDKSELDNYESNICEKEILE